MEFKQYRLNDWDWIHKFQLQYGKEAYHNYVDKVCGALFLLKPGNHYNLSVGLQRESEFFVVIYTDTDGQEKKRVDIDFCIKVCCMWIHTAGDYYFSDDYSKIKRYA